MRTIVTTSIDAEIWQKAKESNISWTDALEFGINFLLADKDGFDYPPCKLQEKVSTLVRLLQEKTAELEEIKNPQKKEELEKEAEEIIKDMGVSGNGKKRK